MTSRTLLILPENGSWTASNALGYSWRFSLEEGLATNRSDVVTFPAFAGFGAADRRGWLGRLQDLLRTTKFDQVWMDVTEVSSDHGLLHFLAARIPVRVAVLPDSLDYGIGELALRHGVAARKSRVLSQIRLFTHAVCADEHDCRLLAQFGFNCSYWLPGLISPRAIKSAPTKATGGKVLLCASKGSPLELWALSNETRTRVTILQSGTDAARFATRFESLNQAVLGRLPSLPNSEFPAPILLSHTKLLRMIATEAHEHNLRSLALHRAAAFADVRPGRSLEMVLNSLATGIPVFVPEQTRGSVEALLGKGVCLGFDPECPQTLLDGLSRLENDEPYARKIAEEGIACVERFFRADTRIASCLEWLRTTPVTTKASSRVELQTAQEPRIAPSRDDENDHYRSLFVNNPAWSSKEPHSDESARWCKISAFIRQAVETIRETNRGELRLLDVGCGRGWLTNLISQYGHAEGVEPVPCVIEHARKLFPQLRFHVGTVGDVLKDPAFQPFDIIVSSEVIEHVPDEAKPAFLGQIQQALRPGGFVILTTPRKEVQPQLQEREQQSNQPVEEWLSEAQVRQLFLDRGFSVLGNERVLCDLRDGSYPNSNPGMNPQVVGLYQVWFFHASNLILQSKRIGREPKTTAYVLTIGDPVFEKCRKALATQSHPCFATDIIANLSPFSAAATEMFRRCETEFLIQVDEDMILFPDTVEKMESCMLAAPEEVGMICFYLYDEDREENIQGIKIYRTEHMRRVFFRDLKASEMDLLEQMESLGIKWIAHPDVVGLHGTSYSLESIYLRYKTMYEKDIRTWNLVTRDIQNKAQRFRETGDPLQLFALLGAAHGIINAPFAADKEKNFKENNLKAIAIFKHLLRPEAPYASQYESGVSPRQPTSQPIPFENVIWRT